MSKEAKNIFNSYEVNCLIWKIRCNVEVLILWRKWSFIPCRFNRILLSQRNRVWVKNFSSWCNFLNIIEYNEHWPQVEVECQRFAILSRFNIFARHLKILVLPTSTNNYFCPHMRMNVCWNNKWDPPIRGIVEHF